jgi:hypothetical protein
MTDVLSLRQNVSEPIHRVLDCLEDIAEGPLGRVSADVLMAEIDLVGDTVFGIAMAPAARGVEESGPEQAERARAQAIAALRHPQAVRMAALILLAIEQSDPGRALAGVLPPKFAPEDGGPVEGAEL